MPQTLEWPPPVAPTQQCTTQWSTLLQFTTSESAVLSQNNLSSLKRIEGMLGSIQDPPPFPYTFTWPGGGFGTNTPGGFRLGMLAIAVARHWNLARTYKYGTRDMLRCAQTALRCFTEATAQPWPDQETLAQTRPPTLHPLVGSYLGLAIEHCILLEEPDQAPMAARIATELSTPSPSALVCRFLKPTADRSAAKFRQIALVASAESLLKQFSLSHKPPVENTPENLKTMKDAVAAALVAATAAGRECSALKEKATVMMGIGFDGGVETSVDNILAELDDASLSLDELVPSWQLEGSVTDHPGFLTSV